MLTRKVRKSSRKGFTLAEASLVLGLAMFAAVVAFAFYTFGYRAIVVNGQANAASALVTDIKRMFNSRSNYVGLTSRAVVDAGILPSGFNKAGSGATTAIYHKWGSEVSIQSLAGANANLKFQIQFNNIPKHSCVDFVNGISGVAQTLTVGSVIVKDVSLDYNPTLLSGATACEAAATGTITLVSE